VSEKGKKQSKAKQSGNNLSFLENPEDNLGNYAKLVLSYTTACVHMKDTARRADGSNTVSNWKFLSASYFSFKRTKYL